MLASLRSHIDSYIKAADRMFKTDIRYILSGGTWSLIGQGGAAICSLGLALVMSRYVSKDTYGTYQYVLAVVSLLSIFSLNNIGAAVMQSTARGLDGAIFDGFRSYLRWSVIVFLGTIGIAAYYLFAGNYALAVALLVGGCLTPFMGSINLYIGFLSGKKDFARGALYADVFGNLAPVLFLGAAAFFYPNFLVLVIVYFVANALTDLFFYWRTIQVYKPDKTRTDPHMLAYGKHLSLIGILGGIAGTIDQILLFHFLGATDLAIYNFSTGIVDQSKGPLKNLDNMMQARFAPREIGDIRANIRNKMLWLFLLSAIAFVVFYVAAPLLYRILFPQYIVSVSYAQVYALTLLTVFMTPLGSYFTAKKLVRELYIDNIFISVARIAMITIGIIWWGLWGLIAARVASAALNACILVFLYWYMPREQNASMST